MKGADLLTGNVTVDQGVCATAGWHPCADGKSLVERLTSKIYTKYSSLCNITGIACRNKTDAELCMRSALQWTPDMATWAPQAVTAQP